MFNTRILRRTFYVLIVINVFLTILLIDWRTSDPPSHPHIRPKTRGESVTEKASSRKRPHVYRYDCEPDHEDLAIKERQRLCGKRGCLWGKREEDPRCYYPQDYTNYHVTRARFWDESRRAEFVMQKSKRPSGFPRDIQKVRITVSGLNDDVVDLRIEEFVSPKHKYRRFKPPFPVIRSNGTTDDPKWQVALDGDSMNIIRKSDKQSLFHTRFRTLIFSDQFLQLVVDVPSHHLYGFGERQGHHIKFVPQKKRERKYSFFNHRSPRDEPSHGSHPFYLMYEKSNDAHGVLFLNSNPSEATLTTAPSIVYRTIGGDLRFLIFLGPDPVDVIRQKAAVVGHSPLPAYWTLGFHLSCMGYKDLQTTRRVLNANIAAGIPIDAQYVDMEYEEKGMAFTIDNRSYGQIHEFADELHRHNRRLIPVTDPEIWSKAPTGSETDIAFRRGKELGIFIRNSDSSLLLTRNRNTDVVLPDFMHPKIRIWWKECLQRLFNRMPFDGLWLDVNEPDVHTGPKTEGWQKYACDKRNKYNKPPYNPIHPLVVDDRTICLSSRHAIGVHYDLHNLYPVFQAQVTSLVLKELLPNRRPFMLSRATTTGMSTTGAVHWTGDIKSEWKYIRNSVASILDFNLFGIPMTGADICGFWKHATDQMCSRWHAIGAFYPFARNHNNAASGVRFQDPVSMGHHVLQSARKHLKTRYELLPLLYTLLFKNSLTGEPVVRSLKMNFPHDRHTDPIDEQMMWGRELLVTPILAPKITSVKAYFPSGVWYDYHSGNKVSQSKTGVFKKLKIPVTEISVTVRGSSIIPIKRGSIVRTTADHRLMPFSLVVALDESGSADGQLYWDDGDGLETMTRGLYFLIDFSVRNNSLTSRVSHHFNYEGNMDLREVLVYGLKGRDHEVMIEDQEDRKVRCSSHFHQGVLSIRLPNKVSLTRDFVLRW